MTKVNSVLVNGVRFGWGNLKVLIFGRTVTGITEINYSDTMKIEDHPGAGVMPVHRTPPSDYKATGDITLYDYEVDAILVAIKAAGGERIQDAAMTDIVVMMVDDQGNITEHVLRNCQFSDNKRGFKAGNNKLENKLVLTISHIEW